jgi:hypothetical protein
LHVALAQSVGDDSEHDRPEAERERHRKEMIHDLRGLSPSTSLSNGAAHNPCSPHAVPIVVAESGAKRQNRGSP